MSLCGGQCKGRLSVTPLPCAHFESRRASGRCAAPWLGSSDLLLPLKPLILCLCCCQLCMALLLPCQKLLLWHLVWKALP